MTAFCRQNGVSENVVFLTAYNYCIAIFSGEKDAISSSIHSGRTDSRWTRLAGPLFLTYLFRYTNIPHETVPQLLKRMGRQIMESMRCHISCLHGDEMFFQYQGDILNIDQIGGLPAERQRVQLDSLPFHLQVFCNDQGYTYELRYWENRFDLEQLQIFMTCLERIVEAMLEEPSVRRLKKHLPENLFPKHYVIKASSLNRLVGFRLINDVSGDMDVKAYVLDNACLKQPFGSWGSLDLLEQGGRTVMIERLMGRSFVDLYSLERLLSSLEGIHRSEAYVRWSEEHKPFLTADLYCSHEPDLEKINAYLESHWDKSLLPVEFRMVKD